MKKKKSFKKDSLLTNEDITSCKFCEFLICLDYKDIWQNVQTWSICMRIAHTFPSVDNHCGVYFNIIGDKPKK